MTDHVNIGDNAMIAAKSVIIKDVPDNSVVAGFPHQDIQDWRKSSVIFTQLGELVKDIRELKKKISDLKKKIK